MEKLPGSLEKLGQSSIREMVTTISTKISHRRDPDLIYMLYKIFRFLFARQDTLLCDPDFLGKLLVYVQEPYDEETFPVFKKSSDDVFLMQMLEGIFHIWEKYKNIMLGDIPYLIMQHFLARGSKEDLLKKFLLLSPLKWLAYYWPILDMGFNLESTFLDHLNPGIAAEKRLIDKIEPLTADKRFWRLSNY